MRITAFQLCPGQFPSPEKEMQALKCDETSPNTYGKLVASLDLESQSLPLGAQLPILPTSGL